MQYVDSASKCVLKCSEIRDKILEEIDVSHQGFAAMQSMLTFQKDSSAFVSERMQTAPWVLYREGVEFVAHERRVVRLSAVTRYDWARLFKGLRKYQNIEDVVADIIGIIVRFEEDNDYRRMYSNMLRIQSNDPNRAMLTNILTTFAGNRDIETVALTLLTDMYTVYQNVFIVPPPYTVQIRLALSCMCQNDRARCTVAESLKLFLVLCRRDLPEVHAVLQQENRDIVLIVLDIQKSFIDCDSIVDTCGSLCDVFLGTWTAPTHLVAVCSTDIILGCMQQYPGSLSRQTVGCLQLFNMCLCNGRNIRYSPETMIGVADFVRQIQHEHPGDGVHDDQREWHLWTFIDEVMLNQHTYRDCIGLFSVAFLQNALACSFAAHGNSDEWNVERHVDCVQIICRLLQKIVQDDPAAIATFVQQDGISVLVKIGHHHVKKDVTLYYSDRFDGHMVCVDFLLDVLMGQIKQSGELFTRSFFRGSKVQRQFSVGNLQTNSAPTTIPVLLVQSLNFSQTSGDPDLIARRYTVLSTTIVNNTLYVLSHASNVGDLVCIDMLPYMRRFLEFVTSFIAGVERDVPAVASVVLTDVVDCYDKFIVNVYRAISVDCEYRFKSLCKCRGLKEYILAGRLYRPAHSELESEIDKIFRTLSVEAY